MNYNLERVYMSLRFNELEDLFIYRMKFKDNSFLLGLSELFMGKGNEKYKSRVTMLGEGMMAVNVNEMEFTTSWDLSSKRKKGVGFFDLYDITILCVMKIRLTKVFFYKSEMSIRNVTEEDLIIALSAENRELHKTLDILNSELTKLEKMSDWMFKGMAGNRSSQLKVMTKYNLTLHQKSVVMMRLNLIPIFLEPIMPKISYHYVYKL